MTDLLSGIRFENGKPVTPWAIPTIESEIKADSASPESPWDFPPGMTGRIAQFIYDAAVKPSATVANAAAVSYMAGIVGRAYNISGMGLNHFSILLAPTAEGKDAASRGIDKLNNAVALRLHPGVRIRRGPTGIPSPQGLRNALAGDGKDAHTSRLCCLSLLDEVGFRFQNICSKKASATDVALRGMILALYSKSGGSNRLGDVVYADRAKNVEELICPAWSFLGESTQQQFYKAFDEENILEGFLTRLHIFETSAIYEGKAKRESHKVEPPADLVQQIADLITLTQHYERYADSNSYYNWPSIVMTDEATEYDDTLERWIIKKKKTFNPETEGHFSDIYSRYREKFLRTSGVLAVGCNSFEPRVTIEIANWARDCVERGTNALIKRFESGKVGEPNPHNAQHDLLINTLKSFVNTYSEKGFNPKHVKNYGMSAEMQADYKLTAKYFYCMMHNHSAFKHSKDVSQSIDSLLKTFVKNEWLRRVGGTEPCRINRSAEIFQIDLSVLRKM